MKYTKKLLSLLLVIAICAGFMIPVSAANTMFTPGDGLINAIKEFEGFLPKRQWDYYQYSIGYGCDFNLAKELFPKDVADDDYVITEEEAVELLLYCSQGNATQLNYWLIANGITVNQNQFDALLDLSLNVGIYQWTGYIDKETGESCRLVKLLKKGPAYWTTAAVQDAFGTWVYAGGERLPGLVTRRAYDAALFLTPVGAELPEAGYGGTVNPDDGTDPDDGTTPDDGTAPDDGTTPDDGTAPDDGTTPDDGTAPDDGTTPDDGTAPDDGTTPGDGTTPEEVTGYLDVPEDAWYHDYVYEATELGLMKGIGNNLFEPEREVTRAEVVQAMANFAGADLSGYNSTSFSDVFLSDWFAPAVQWASEKEYVNGSGLGTFLPKDTIIREHLCNILARYLQRQGFVKTEEVELFTDDALISETGRENVYFCVAMGIVNGTGDGSFSPNTGATRSQLAKLLVEMHGIVYAAG